MGIDELCTLPVADLAAPDSVLFLGYVPAAPGGPAAHQGVGLHLQERCFRLAEENRKSEGWFYGLGFWTRGNAEICLLATRGHPKRQAANVHQFIISPSRSTAAKAGGGP